MLLPLNGPGGIRPAATDGVHDRGSDASTPISAEEPEATARLALARFIHGTPLGNTGKTEDPVNGELTTKGGSRRLKEKFG